MFLKSKLQQMPLRQALSIIALICPFSVSADWSAKLNHLVIKDDFLLARNTSHQATTVGLGYQYDFTESTFLSTNTYFGVAYDSERPLFSSSNNPLRELDKLYGVDVRFGYQACDWLSPFIGAQYLRQEFSASQTNTEHQEVTLSNTDLIIGAEFKMLEDFSLELAYSDKSAGKVLLLGLNYKF